MRKKCLLLMGIFALGILNAQVGINTRSPQGVFHVDGQGNTNGSLNVSDDFVINKYGNTGIGTATPQKMLDIRSTTPGAIRINDTSQGVDRVLTSSLNGSASWVNILGKWNATINGGSLPYSTTLGERKVIFSGGSTSKPGVGYVDIVNSSMIVPYTGAYRLTIFGTSLTNRATDYFIAGYYGVKANNVVVWVPHSLGYASMSTSPYVSYYTVVYLTQNTELTVYTEEQSPLYANAVSNLTLLVEFIK